MISILIPSGILLAVFWARYFLDRYKSGKHIPLIVPLAFTCLFIPKINLITVNQTYSTAGIRTDDFLVVIMLVTALRESFTYRNKYIKWGLLFLAALSAAALVSMITGIRNGLENNVLFSILSIVRKYEYFAFALVGIYIARKTEIARKTVLKEFTWLSFFHVIIGLMQVAGLCNYAVSGSLGSTQWVTNVAVSTFNGHYEYGHFLCFGVAIYLSAFLRKRKLWMLGMVLVSCVMIWLTESRSSMMAGIFLIVVILLVFAFRKDSSRALRISASAVILAALIAGVLFAAGMIKIGKFNFVNLSEYVDVLKQDIEHGDLRLYAENIRAGIPDKEAASAWISDRSASIRFYKWGAALNGFRQFPLFGYGTGVTQVMDGSYVKMLGEAGIAGLLLWLAMFGFFMKAVWDLRHEATAARSVFWMMLSILIASVFIDMFEASKPMEMLWLAVGLVIGTASTKPGEEEILTRWNAVSTLKKTAPAAAFGGAVLLLYLYRGTGTVSLVQVSAVVLAVYWGWYLLRKRREIPLTVPLLFTCFFLPKLNLLKVSGLSNAGIRADDLLALALLIAAVVRDAGTWKNRYIRRGIEILAVLSAVNLLSLASGLIQGYGNQILLSILMIIRKFEYFAFALIGAYTVRCRKMKDPYRTFMNEFTVMSLLHALLGILQILGKTTYVVSGTDAADFFQGIAVSTFNGYYEYGQFLCFGCAIFLCDFLKRKNGASFVMLILTLGMLVLSKSRSSLIVGVLLIILIVYFPIRSRIPRRRLLIGGLGLIGALAAGLLIATGILGSNPIGRFGTVKPDELAENWNLFVRRGNFPQYVSLLREGVAEMDAIDQLHYLDKITDWSAAVRYLKWFAALDGFRLNPVLGYGTGVTHVMDGNYIKLLAETGIAGTALWLGFYGYFMYAVHKCRRASQLAKALLFIMVSILLNSLLLDMFEASKPMEMMWLMVGGAVVFAKGCDSQVRYREAYRGDLSASVEMTLEGVHLSE